MARVQSQPGPDTTGICSLCHRAFMGSFESSSRVRRQSVFTNFRVAYCHCCASCNCCHDPFIVRSAQTRPPFTGFHSACTPVSMFTINAENCLFLCSCLLVCSSVTKSIVGSSPSSCSSRIPILKTCNVVVVLKQRLASFQHLRSSSH